MIHLLYFASLRERLELEKETLTLPPGVHCIADLKSWLSQRGEPWQSVFSGREPILAAVNQEMADDSTVVRDGDEIGFFPPVTGG